MKYIKQRSASDCGVACLCMIAWHYGKKLPYTEVYEAVGADKSGSSIYGVCEAAKRYQLEPIALQGTASELIDEINSSSIQLPLMVRVVNQNQQSHFVIITSVGKSKIRICDPDDSIRKKSIPISFFEKIFLGEVITFQKCEDFKKENRHKSPLFSFFKYIARQKTAIFVIIAASLLVSGIGLLSSLMLRYLIDDVLQAGTAETMDEGLELFALMMTGMILLYFVRFVIQLIRGKISSKFSGRINQQILTDVYQKMIDLPLQFFGSKETGELMSRYSDATKINQALSSLALTIGLDLIMFVGAGIMIHRLSPVLFHYALFIALVYTIISLCYHKPLEHMNRKAVIEGAAVNSYLKETTDGIGTIKTCNAGTSAKKKFITMVENFQTTAIKASMKNIRKDSLIEACGSIGILAFLWVGAVNVIGGDLTTGTLITVYSMLSYFITPIQNIIEMQSNLQEAYIAAERLEDIYDYSVEQQTGISKDIINGDVQVESVSFQYPNSNIILNDFSMHIESGSAVALIGPSGCGKSTVAKLMTRLYNVTEGTIHIGGCDINEISLDTLRSSVVYIPQEITLFSDTIRNNLLLGIERDVTDDEISEVLDQCDCSFLRDKGMTIDSIVEEGGTNFSGGQLKRLALARALLRKPKVLILDETTANLNDECVKHLASRINNLPMTKIWITHNPSKISGLDRILSIDQQITEVTTSSISDLKAAAAT